MLIYNIFIFQTKYITVLLEQCFVTILHSYTYSALWKYMERKNEKWEIVNINITSCANWSVDSQWCMIPMICLLNINKSIRFVYILCNYWENFVVNFLPPRSLNQNLAKLFGPSKRCWRIKLVNKWLLDGWMVTSGGAW